MGTALEKGQMVLKKAMHDGYLAKKVEQVTHPSEGTDYVSLAVGGLVLSAGLYASGRRHLGNFVGLWVPSLLIFGLSKRFAKVEEKLLAKKGNVSF